MIIIEGPDGSGKTTLAKRLSEEMGWPIGQKVVGSDTKPLTNLQEWVDGNLNRGYHPGIYDRHRLISEPVYSAVLPNRVLDENFWDPNWLAGAYHRLHSISPFVIMCMPPLDVVVKNVAGDPNNQVVANHIHQLYLTYFHQGLIHSELPTVWYDYTRHAHDDGHWRQLAFKILSHSFPRMEIRDRHSLDQFSGAVHGRPVGGL